MKVLHVVPEQSLAIGWKRFGVLNWNPCHWPYAQPKGTVYSMRCFFAHSIKLRRVIYDLNSFGFGQIFVEIGSILCRSRILHSAFMENTLKGENYNKIEHISVYN